MRIRNIVSCVLIPTPIHSCCAFRIVFSLLYMYICYNEFNVLLFKVTINPVGLGSSCYVSLCSISMGRGTDNKQTAYIYSPACLSRRPQSGPRGEEGGPCCHRCQWSPRGVWPTSGGEVPVSQLSQRERERSDNHQQQSILTPTTATGAIWRAAVTGFRDPHRPASPWRQPASDCGMAWGLALLCPESVNRWPFPDPPHADTGSWISLAHAPALPAYTAAVLPRPGHLQTTRLGRNLRHSRL